MCWGLFKKKKKQDIPDFKLSLDKIKKQANILFIDNEDVALVETLKTEGWHVEAWKDIKSLSDLEQGKFDLIFLDIGGVGQAYSPEDEGFGILKRLKHSNPAVLVVAYSGMSFDASKAEFWKLADGNLSKAGGAIKAIELMEELLSQKFNSTVLWNDLLEMLRSNNVSENEIRKIQEIILNTGKKTFDSTSISRILQKTSTTASTASALVNLSAKIAAILAS